MAIIKIRGREDAIIRPYAVAKQIKQRKFGDPLASPPVPKASPSDLLDLGDEWGGTYGQIVSIELNDRPRAVLPQIEERELTPEEKARARKKMDEIGNELRAKGII